MKVIIGLILGALIGALIVYLKRPIKGRLDEYTTAQKVLFEYGELDDQYQDEVPFHQWLEFKIETHKMPHNYL